MIIDMQSQLLEELKTLLRGIGAFGDYICEDSAVRILDSDDDGLPDDLIVLQETGTEEVERIGAGNVRERLSVSIVLFTRRRRYGPALRAARLEIKKAMRGTKGGLSTPGLQTLTFGTETPMHPEEGRRWACRVIPVTALYVQPLQ